MSLDYLHPFAGQHAIQSAAFAMDFSTELDVGEVERLRASATELKSDFPNIQDQHRTTINFQFAPGKQDASTAQDIGGFRLERPAPGGVPAAPLRAIGVSRSNLIVAINDYTRWSKFKADAERYLGVLLKSINAQKGISSVSLQFSDAFVWRADPADMVLTEIFSETTQYLAPSVFAKKAVLWHSHHGYLIDQTAPVAFQELDNINVSRNLVAGAHQLQILTSHKATFPRPIFKILDANKDKVSTIMDLLHKKNKEILADVLTEEVQKKIGLNLKGE